jgi:hypothetical protein
MVVDLNSWAIHTFCYIVKFAEGRYKLEVRLVLILCTCELNRNWSLFLITNESTEKIHWDWIRRIFSSLNSCQQEAFLFEFIIILILCSFFLLPDWTPTTFCVPSRRSLWSHEKTLSVRNTRQSNPQIPFHKLILHLPDFNFSIHGATCWILEACKFKNSLV